MLPRLRDALERTGRSFEIIVVDDASRDGSADRIDPAEFVVLRHSKNAGKGAALRTGFGVCTGQFVGFIDGDGQYDPCGLVELLTLCERGWDVVIGQRWDEAAQVDYSLWRRGLSGLMQQLVRRIVDPSLSETQAGIKVFRGEVIRAVDPHLRSTGFSIDVEILALAKRMGFRRHGVHPIKFHHDGDSTVTAARSLAMVRDLFKIRSQLSALQRSATIAASTSTPSLTSLRKERVAMELLAHATRLAALQTARGVAIEELSRRAKYRPVRVEYSLAIAPPGDRRGGDQVTDATQLLEDTAALLRARSRSHSAAPHVRGVQPAAEVTKFVSGRAHLSR
jgi:hypothetical protein